MPILSHDEVRCVAMFSNQPKFKRLTALKKASKVVAKRYEFLDHPHAARIARCAPQLRLRVSHELGEEEAKYSFEGVHWCRCRWCPMCMYAKSNKWMAKFLKAFASKPYLPDDPQFIFMTLTVKNCKLSELRATVNHMSKAWKKLVARTDSPIEGFLRSLEITAQLTSGDKTKLHKVDGELMVHPHFHAILAVPSDYFEFSGARKYQSFEKWRAAWKKALGCDYDPIINVKRVTASTETGKNSGKNSMVNAVAETFKYCIKPAEFVDFGEDSTELLQGITEQTRYLRSVNVGGYFAKHISQKELDKIEDSLEFDEAVSQVGELLQADWLESERWRFSFPEKPNQSGVNFNY